MTHWIIETIVHDNGHHNHILCGRRVQCRPGVWIIEGDVCVKATDTFEMRTRYVNARGYFECMARYGGRRIAIHPPKVKVKP